MSVTRYETVAEPLKLEFGVNTTVPEPVVQVPTPAIVNEPTQLAGLLGLMMQPTSGRMLLVVGLRTLGVVGLVSPLALPTVGGAGLETTADMVPTAV